MLAPDEVQTIVGVTTQLNHLIQVLRQENEERDTVGVPRQVPAARPHDVQVLLEAANTEGRNNHYQAPGTPADALASRDAIMERLVHRRLLQIFSDVSDASAHYCTTVAQRLSQVANLMALSRGLNDLRGKWASGVTGVRLLEGGSFAPHGHKTDIKLDFVPAQLAPGDLCSSCSRGPERTGGNVQWCPICRSVRCALCCLEFPECPTCKSRFEARDEQSRLIGLRVLQEVQRLNALTRRSPRKTREGVPTRR